MGSAEVCRGNFTITVTGGGFSGCVLVSHGGLKGTDTSLNSILPTVEPDDSTLNVLQSVLWLDTTNSILYIKVKISSGSTTNIPLGSV